jgi:tetratricopeptide (TPR) repeat protein
MKGKSKTIKFPRSPTEMNAPHYEDVFLDFEFSEPYQEFLDKRDYPGLVQYCKQQAEQRSNDLYAQYNLGDAYVLNGEYEKAIQFMSEHHRRHPWNQDYQHVILKALFALGKTEDDFNWTEKPVVLRLSDNILDICYEMLKRKRKPRSLIELHTQLLLEGYLAFTEDDLLNALVNDGRFSVDNADSAIWAEVKKARKKRK